MEQKNNNPLNLEIGKEYWVRYIPANGVWKKITITRFTDAGYPWQEGRSEHVSGILTDDYEVSITVPEDIKRGDYYIGQLGHATDFFEEYPEELIKLAKRKGLLTNQDADSLAGTVHFNACVATIKKCGEHWGLMEHGGWKKENLHLTLPAHPPINMIKKMS